MIDICDKDNPKVMGILEMDKPLYMIHYPVSKNAQELDLSGEPGHVME